MKPCPNSKSCENYTMSKKLVLENVSKHFGSLVAVVLPQREDVRVVVQPGDRVAAGVTVLARYVFEEQRERT